MYRKIVTHGGRAHLDDFLSVALLTHKYDVDYIVRVGSIDPRSTDSYTIVVDVGMVYEPPRLLDHHARSDLPCTFFLVVKHHAPELEETLNLPEMRYLDVRDRMGIYRALGISIPPEVRFTEKVFLDAFSEQKVISRGDSFYSFIKVYGEMLYRYLSARLAQEKISEKRARRIKLFSVGRYIAGVLEPGIPALEYSKRIPLIDIVIQRAKSGRRTFIYKTRDSVELSEIEDIVRREGGRISYRHPSGFMIVADDITVDKITSRLKAVAEGDQ